MIKKYYLLLLILLISACSQQATIPTHNQQTHLPIPNEWFITAKLGIRSTDNSGSVTVYWQQHDTYYHIRAVGPLGQGGGTITGNNKQITIKRANKPTLHSNHPETLIEDSFGWELPLQHLSHWVRGLPSPYLTTTQQELNDSGTLKNLTQAEWTLSYDRYQNIEAWLMPKKIKAEKDGVKLTLIIKKWELNPQPKNTALLID